MSYNTTHIFLSLLLVLCYGLTAVGQEKGVRPSLEGLHYSHSCHLPLPTVPPAVLGCVPTDYRLTHTDKTYELGCVSRGFTGYFALSRWEGTQGQSDDGVDVTGALNSVLVEGANSASIIVLPRSEASFGIVLPADGFITFDWGYIGGSPFYDQQFTVYINDTKVEQLSASCMSGAYTSAGLEAGDFLRFEASAAEQGFEVRLHQFEFLTNAAVVIEREWTAHLPADQSATYTQWIALEKPDFSHLLFPPHFDGRQQPMLQSHHSDLPTATGFPAIDTDGDWATTYDQLRLDDEEQYGLQAKWEDEMIYDGQQCVIYRHWTVHDLCGNNVQTATQIIMVQGGCPNDANASPPAPSTEQAPLSRPNFLRQPELQIISCNDAWHHLPAEDPFFP